MRLGDTGSHFFITPLQRLLLLFGVSILMPTAALWALPSLSWNFSQGALGGWEHQDERIIYLQLASPPDHPWFFFRVDDAENQLLQFVIEKAPADRFQPFYMPVISYDQRNWSFIKNVSALHEEEGNFVRFSFEVALQDERAWIAYAPPYPNTKLDEWILSLSDHPHVEVETLLQTPVHEFNLPLLTITDHDVDHTGKSRIWIVSREGGNESASTWISIGAVQFLLSENPVAQAVKRRSLITFIPMMDRDAVETGSSRHPLNNTKSVDWKTTWNEKDYSFYEQRTLKHHWQIIQDSSQSVQLCIRLQSDASGQDLLYREPIAKEKEAEQDRLVLDLLNEKYLPWYSAVERQPMNGIFSEPLRLLFPEIIPLSLKTGSVYHHSFGYDFSFPKSTDDLMLEGEMLMYAIAEALGVPASAMPPYLLGAEIYRAGEAGVNTHHVRCVYLDTQNQAPEYVRVVINDQPIDLKPAGMEPHNDRPQILYTGFIQVNSPVNTHYFIASNGTKTIRIPRAGTRPGPYALPAVRR